MTTIASRCLLSYKWLSTPLANLSYFHIFLVYIGGNFALFLPIFVNTRQLMRYCDIRANREFPSR